MVVVKISVYNWTGMRLLLVILAILAIRDCSDLPKGYRSGIFKIQTTNLKSDGFNVYCQMVVDGGGWTVIQRRESGDLNFFLEWTKYMEGFGQLNREF